ncbi:ELF1_2_4 [Mytilus edulis]|uniref:ELF1_2_4 n=1 Tax=Mytilus edulis TaxID=6550 RepID=A0A8S3QJ94_MYTED|nr:ELF1_2_4 [Mytilus edulis]
MINRILSGSFLREDNVTRHLNYFKGRANDIRYGFTKKFDLYSSYDPNNNGHYIYTDPLDYPIRPMHGQFMLSGTDYHYTTMTCPGSSDLDDSHESDDSSVILDQVDMEMIEFYERDVEEKYSHTEQFQQSLNSAPYQQLCKPQQSNNLPAFETLFKGNRHSNNVNRLSSNHVMSDSEDDEESSSICRKGKRGAKNVLLWKFLLEELKKGKHVEWTDISQGTFRFVDTSEISRLWGNMKRKDDMNFEKLSRGIRHYYKSGFMSRQEGTRLIYRFNWAKVPKKYRQYDPKRGMTIKHQIAY